MSKKILAVIPVRYAATRLPGKPLLDIAGKPMVQHVYERAIQACVNEVVVATDHERIFNVVKAFGGHVVMTSPNHLSGTDRVAEAAQGSDADLVVNLQGDEPLLDPASINRAVAPLLADSTIPMGTLAHVVKTVEEIADPNVVKVVRNIDKFALYFSRSAIPFVRTPKSDYGGVLRHIGIYVFRADFLQTFSQLPPSELEKLENLEQLRALEYGYRIRVEETDQEVVGVDTLADLERVRSILERGWT